MRVRYAVSRSLSLLQLLLSSLYPHLAPPQSSLTRLPARVMPYRSHVQHELRLLTELAPGELELLLRLLSDGTAELRSECESLLSSPDDESSSYESLGRRCWCAMRLASCSTARPLYCSDDIMRVACGLVGRGDWICEGESERPLGTSEAVIRRLWPWLLGARREDLTGGAAGGGRGDGMSRTLSLRPVVGSVVDSRAGSCET